MLQIDDINFSAAQLEQECGIRLALGYTREVIAGTLRWRRDVALPGVEVITR